MKLKLIISYNIFLKHSERKKYLNACMLDGTRQRNSYIYNQNTQFWIVEVVPSRFCCRSKIPIRVFKRAISASLSTKVSLIDSIKLSFACRSTFNSSIINTFSWLVFGFSEFLQFSELTEVFVSESFNKLDLFV